MCEDNYAYEGAVKDVIDKFVSSTLRVAIYNRSMYGMGLSEDPDAPVNVSYAKFFDLNTVSISHE
ncbi:hypothetical protein [Butyrivibrio sp. FCS014]|uniref:hypothetical protein n=1 Tax=Butyrivibrio sp. FCS014 TaxID=1408304 RepID=UPI0004ADD876|nr:hypothetical protein [Butyrivibrio sp. FCS014]